jgi:hypothetical protein
MSDAEVIRAKKIKRNGVAMLNRRPRLFEGFGWQAYSSMI